MEKLSNSSHFLDLGGLDSLRSQAQKDEKAALKEVAKQFEGIFIQMLMKSMRDANAAFKSDSPMNSQTTEFFENMRDQQMSVDLSDKGMLGIADLMVQQLSPQDTPFKPASVLRGDIDAKINHSLFDAAPKEASVNQASTMNTSSLNAIESGKPAVNINQLSSSHSVIDEQTLEKILAGNAAPSVASSGNQLPQTIHQAPTEFENPEHFVSVL